MFGMDRSSAKLLKVQRPKLEAQNGASDGSTQEHLHQGNSTFQVSSINSDFGFVSNEFLQRKYPFILPGTLTQEFHVKINVFDTSEYQKKLPQMMPLRRLAFFESFNPDIIFMVTCMKKKGKKEGNKYCSFESVKY